MFVYNSRDVATMGCGLVILVWVIAAAILALGTWIVSVFT